jgi:hypothetical protein
VMKSRDFIVHQDDDDLRLMARADSSACELAFVLKGQLQSRSELGHFAVLDLHIHFTTSAMRRSRSVPAAVCTAVFRRILPGLRTRPITSVTL